ncbi:unnamed protein product [Eretmochelys imbricata]
MSWPRRPSAKGYSEVPDSSRWNKRKTPEPVRPGDGVMCEVNDADEVLHAEMYRPPHMPKQVQELWNFSCTGNVEKLLFWT